MAAALASLLPGTSSSNQTSAAAKALQENQSAATIKVENTTKRDFLVALEKKYQAKWAEDKVFEVDSPARTDESLRDMSPEELREKYPKFFGTFPYAYMNGSLHLGHGFSISKLEFATGFERMLGKRVLFPNAYHCTGMPIKAAADKLVRELEMFGQDLERYQDEEDSCVDLRIFVVDAAQIIAQSFFVKVRIGHSLNAHMPTSHRASDPTPPVGPPPGSSSDTTAPTTSTTASNPEKSKKGKLAAKATGLKHQFQIMESIGVPRSEIKKFADPKHWLDYFPPIAQADLTALGARIDWRRSFVTTDVNPYYDTFVRWQMNRLYEMDYIRFGKRFTIFSPKDGQPCMDHDRASGEGVGPQEYTAMKLELAEWSPKAQEHLGQLLGGKRVFFVAATLRPETMYGQTNCFVGKTLKYGLYAAKHDEVYLCTERAARNMTYQDLLRKEGEIEKLAEIDGASLIGTKVRPPLSIHKEVYILPMDGVLANKGTGVVTSVPSDSPDDFQTLTDLRKKPEYYGIEAAWVAYDPVPVLKTAKYGEMSAPVLVKQLKIQSQKDTKLLAEAKELAYKEGFYNGEMLVGDFKGERVEVAKNKVRAQIIDAGQAFLYSEPEGVVMSRSADECVVALCDQYYMAYGGESWKPKATELLKRMNTYDGERGSTRAGFEAVLDWLHEWACSRSYGLGSKIPWAPQYLVESLSDSTIYMAYYTFAHLLQGNVHGTKPGLLGIKPEQMTDEVWDYVFCRRSSLPDLSPLSQDDADALKREFEYFYPMDLRTSGKDLIPNHLSFCIYVHSALFQEKHWPRAMRANGHLLLNGEKMSKSTGNSLTLRDSIAKFGADATRICLADSGDSMDDANFVEEVASSQSERLHELVNWCQQMVESRDQLRTGPTDSFFDRAFAAEIDRAIVETRAAYTSANYKEALKSGFYDFLNARKEYRKATEKEGGMHRDLIDRFIRTSALLVTPIAPHFAEHVWSTILKEPRSVQFALFPEPAAALNEPLLRQLTFIREQVVKTIRDGELNQAKRAGKAKGGKATGPVYDATKPASEKALRIFVAQSYPPWQIKTMEVLRDLRSRANGAEISTKETKEALSKLDDGAFLKTEKRAMPFAALQLANAAREGDSALDMTVPFDELALLTELRSYLQRELGFGSVDVVSQDAARQKVALQAEQGAEAGWSKQHVEMAEPLKPGFELYNS